MAISDHINLLALAGISPLSGREGLEFGERFIDLKDAYDPELLRLARDVAQTTLKTDLRTGVYVMIPGPAYETPAEGRMLRLLGADAVGMSTAPEVLAARQLGMRVLGLSCITDLVFSSAPVNHEDVQDVSRRSSDAMGRLIEGVVKAL